ncbi:Major facilitator superfamily,Major facilitator superfamily domain [Cinara cedri]|uniref:Major facilitator superfamily,Major facilitator superfamily domain n=1 Tax=Cinara cedri TaxID=506608 RepID=A0A5E4MST9_9HEMI|nr:Major facilitator superfamily,Major facilitator superfamily domain [Cinara cedri]
MQKRTILWYMTFWGFGMNFMLRMNLNIAIVSMVRNSVKTSNDKFKTELYENYSFANASLSINASAHNNNHVFEWDEHQQNTVMGAFFWLHMVLQIPGGMLAQKFGAKSIFGFSNGLVALLTCAIPVTAKNNFVALLVLRVVQGLVAGTAWPAMHSMTGKWIPADERSRFVSAYLGSSFGTAMTYMVCGYLIESLGWESVFYITGLIGLLWHGLWTYLIYDTPGIHPTISEKERKYIEDSLGNDVVKNVSSKIPWRSITTSVPLIVNIVSQIGYNWGMYTLCLQAPTYFKFVLGFDLKRTGFWSGIPYLFLWPFSFTFGCACDYLIKANIMSITNVRKLACVFSNIVHGLFILTLSFAGYNDVLVIFSMVSAVVVSGAISSGALPGIVDLAPNHAGVLQGINGTIVNCCISISPYIVGLITFQQQTIEQWKKVFVVSATVCFITGIAFLLFGSCEIQKWNNDEQKDKKEIKPMV